MLDKILNLIGGIFTAVLPLSVGLFIAALCWDTSPDWRGALWGSLVALLSIYIAVRIFLHFQRVGFADFVAQKDATDEVYNLSPDEHAPTKVYSATEYLEAFTIGNVLAPGGCIQVFGDWFGEPYTNDHRISKVSYTPFKDYMLIEFEAGGRIEIWNPLHIVDSETFLKVVSASAVRLSWPSTSTKRSQYYYNHYTRGGKKDQRKSNFTGKQRRFSSDLSKPALMIYVKF